jgi:hypothetical protein
MVLLLLCFFLLCLYFSFSLSLLFSFLCFIHSFSLLYFCFSSIFFFSPPLSSFFFFLYLPLFSSLILCIYRQIHGERGLLPLSRHGTEVGWPGRPRCPSNFHRLMVGHGSEFRQVRGLKERGRGGKQW